jgi:hypothetical protein
VVWSDDTGRRLRHLVDMFTVLNSCGIRGNVSPNQAHDPINKNRGLVRRYAALRAASQGARMRLLFNSRTRTITNACPTRSPRHATLAGQP